MSDLSEIRVIVSAHPLRREIEEAVVPGGQTLVEIMGRADLPAVIYVDGEIIEREQWPEVRPQSHVVIQRVPQGDIGRIIGTIAIVALAAWAGPAAAAAMGLTQTTMAAGTVLTTAGQFVAAGVTAAVAVVGQLALNALIPPPVPGGPNVGESETLSAITGQSNRVIPFAPIPRLLGRRRYFPVIPMTATPYTELVGRDQYLRMMLCLGYGPLEIGGVTAGTGEPLITEATLLTGNPIKIGDTSIDQIDGVEFEIGDPDDVTLYVQSITETPVGVSLDPASAPTARNQTITDNQSAIRTTEPDADEFSIELVFPALFSVSSDGDTTWAEVTYKVEYAPAGSGSWTVADAAWKIGAKQRGTVREGRRYVLPSTGQYDVRLTRVETYYQRGTDAFADSTWRVLRSITRDEQPFDIDGTVVMALRVPAEAVTGIVDRLSVEATSILPIWNGSAWVEQATRSPAWAYVDILSGAATRSPIPKADINATALKSWADWCDTQGLYYDEVLDAGGTVFDRAREAATAGLGSWSVEDDGQVSIVRDIAGQTPKMLITPRIASGFQTERVFRSPPHALRVQFVDDSTWEPTEITVYDDGYTAANATRFSQLRLVGVTDSDQAWKLGRYHLAQIRLRPETHSWEQDIQHLVYARGDTVEIAQDVILVGLGWGRIKSLTTNVDGDATAAEVDEILSMESGESYALKIQRQDGSIVTAPIDLDVGDQTSVTFSSPVSDLSAGDSFTFGISGSETLLARVMAVEPSGDLSARVVAVDAAEDIFGAWSGTIPTYNPVITAPVDQSLRTPNTPEIESVQSGVQSGSVAPDGGQATTVSVEFVTVGGIVGEQIEARVRNRETPDGTEIVSMWRRAGVVDSEAGVLKLDGIDGIEAGQTIDIQIRARRGIRVSPWTTTATHTVGAGTVYGKAHGQNLLPVESTGQFTDSSIGGWDKQYFGATGIALSDLDLDGLDITSGGVDLQTTGDQQGKLVILYLDASGAELSRDQSSFVDTGGDWQRILLENLEIPDTVGATSVERVAFNLDDDNSATSGSITWRRPMFNRGPFALPYEPPPARVSRGEVENGATANVIYRQTTAPAGTNGDIWHDTDDDLLYRHNGSAWELIANGFDDTSQLTDGASLGDTAIWALISGSGKAEDNATRNQLFRQTTAPTASSTGDLWYDTDDELLYRWSGSSWVLYAPSGGQTATTVTDSDSGTTSAQANIVRGGAQTQINVGLSISGSAFDGGDPFPVAVVLRRGGPTGTILKQFTNIEGRFEAGAGGDPDFVFLNWQGSFIDTNTGTGSTGFYVSGPNTAYNETLEVTATQTYFS